MKSIKIFSGTSNLPLARGVCENLNMKLGDIYHHQFPSGETYCQFKENIRGSDVFLIQGITFPANNNLMELLVMADAARRASADRITAVIPYLGYARQDRKNASRVPITAKLVLDLIETSGVDRIVTMDLHSPQVGGFTNKPLDHLTFEPILSEFIKKKYSMMGLSPKDIILMGPDVGAVKRVEKYATLTGADFGFVSKKRLGDEHVELQSIVGDVKGKVVFIIDDMTESCGTSIQAAAACKENGATYVVCAVTHGAFTDVGMTRLSLAMPNPNIKDKTPAIDEFIHSDTINHWWSHKYKPQNITKLNTTGIFAKAIINIHNNESVSELFV